MAAVLRGYQPVAAVHVVSCKWQLPFHANAHNAQASRYPLTCCTHLWLSCMASADAEGFKMGSAAAPTAPREAAAGRPDPPPADGKAKAEAVACPAAAPAGWPGGPMRPDEGGFELRRLLATSNTHSDCVAQWQARFGRRQRRSVLVGYVQVACPRTPSVAQHAGNASASVDLSGYYTGSRAVQPRAVVAYDMAGDCSVARNSARCDHLPPPPNTCTKSEQQSTSPTGADSCDDADAESSDSWAERKEKLRW